jgi:hypothetical protein
LGNCELLAAAYKHHLIRQDMAYEAFCDSLDAAFQDRGVYANLSTRKRIARMVFST